MEAGTIYDRCNLNEKRSADLNGRVQSGCWRGTHHQLIAGGDTDGKRGREQSVCGWPCTHPRALVTHREGDPWRDACVAQGASRIGSRGKDWSFNLGTICFCFSTWTRRTTRILSSCSSSRSILAPEVETRSFYLLHDRHVHFRHVAFAKEIIEHDDFATLLFGNLLCVSKNFRG